MGDKLPAAVLEKGWVVKRTGPDPRVYGIRHPLRHGGPANYAAKDAVRFDRLRWSVFCPDEDYPSIFTIRFFQTHEEPSPCLPENRTQVL